MSTDIHGVIEYRYPGDPEYYEGDSWLPAIDLWPLLDRQSYQAFACLFGIRNSFGFQPLAPARGVPADASSASRDFRQEGYGPPSWVTWAELKTLDLDGPVAYQACSADPPVPLPSILGEGTSWPEVFAVLRALAGRFGDDGVRLVVYFA